MGGRNPLTAVLKSVIWRARDFDMPVQVQNEAPRIDPFRVGRFSVNAMKAKVVSCPPMNSPLQSRQESRALPSMLIDPEAPGIAGQPDGAET
jgi:hypothetical protein